MVGHRTIWIVAVIARYVMIVKKARNTKIMKIMRGGIMNNQTNSKGLIMDSIQTLIPYLQNLVEKNNCAISVSKINNEFVVSVIGRFRTRTFKAANSGILITNIKRYIQA